MRARSSTAARTCLSSTSTRCRRWHNSVWTTHHDGSRTSVCPCGGCLCRFCHLRMAVLAYCGFALWHPVRASPNLVRSHGRAALVACSPLTLASPADHVRGPLLDHHVPHHAGMVRPRLDRQRAVLGVCVARHLLVCVLHLGQHGRQASTPHGLVQLPWAAV